MFCFQIKLCQCLWWFARLAYITSPTVEIFLLPPKSSDILQLLDRAVFRSLNKQFTRHNDIEAREWCSTCMQTLSFFLWGKPSRLVGAQRPE